MTLLREKAETSRDRIPNSPSIGLRGKGKTDM